MSFVTNFGLKAIHSKAFCCRYLHSTSASRFFYQQTSRGNIEMFLIGLSQFPSSFEEEFHEL
jgi:hypothetical protein